jgi:hypothetical protein
MTGLGSVVLFIPGRDQAGPWPSQWEGERPVGGGWEGGGIPGFILTHIGWTDFDIFPKRTM